MNEVEIEGIVRDLRHLNMITVGVAGKGRDGADLVVGVSFGLHAVSESSAFGKHDFLDENGKPRKFSEARYAFSLGLPELARRMISQNYFCWESADRHRKLNYAVIDVAPGRIRELHDGEHQIVFFYIYPSSVEGVDVTLAITSCYARHVAFSRIKRRFTIHMLLRKSLYEQKRVP